MTNEDAGQRRRVLIAARLSKISEKGRTRIERDDQAAQKWAAAQGDRRVVATSEDAGVSGSTDPFKRPGLGPYLTKPELIVTYDELVASTLDRLGRNARDLAKLRGWAEDNGKRITILKPTELHWPPDPGDIASPIVWVVLEQLAEIELKIITGRIADNQRDLVDRGAFTGRQCWGFNVVGEKGSKTLVPDPELAAKLRGMVDRALRGDTLLSIAQWLDTEGIPTDQGGNWSPKSVSQILRNPALKGRRYDAKGRTILKHEGILTAAEWNDLQTALDKPNRRGPVNGASAVLTGSVLCDLCGGQMYRHRSYSQLKDGTRQYNLYYRCTGTDKQPSRCRNSIPLDDVEAFVNLWFTEDGPFARTEIVETVVVNGADHSAEVAEIDADIRGLDLDDEDYDRKLKVLRTERKRLKELPAEPSRVEEHPTGKTVGQVWAKLSDVAKRKYLIAAGVKVHVRPGVAESEEVLAGMATVGGFTSVKVGPVIASGTGAFPLTEVELIERSVLSGRLQFGAHHTYWITGEPSKVTGTLRAIEVDTDGERPI